MSQRCQIGLLSLVLLMGAGAASYADTEVLYGRVVIDAVRDYGIGIALDQRTFRNEPDGIFDRLFVLETVGLIPDEFPITIDDARLLVREDGVVATARNKPLVLGFFMSENSKADEEQLDSLVMENGDRPLAQDALFVYSGFGFSRTNGEWHLPLDNSWLYSPTEGTCTSGGIGSTACSLTCGRRSCSISCASGYYSCCNCGVLLASCKCIAIAGGGGGGSGGGGGGSGASLCGVPAGGFCPVACLRCSLVF